MLRGILRKGVFGQNCALNRQVRQSPDTHLVLNFSDAAPPSPRGVLAYATPRRLPLRLMTRYLSAVMEKMRSAPINDFFVKNGKIREDGRMVHEMYLYEVKKPAESKGGWDYYKLVATIPADQAFQPLSESKCPLVKKM
jgi:hypothetical protein